MEGRKKSKLPAVLCGLFAGACNGLFGAGAGMVLAPSLQTFTDVKEDALFPTVLAAVIPFCLVSLTIYGMQGELPWQAAWPYLIGSTLGGVISGFFGQRIPAFWLHKALGVILLLGAWRAIF